MKSNKFITLFEISALRDLECTLTHLIKLLLACLRHSCGLPPSIENGNYNLQDHDTKFKANATYTCNPGYKMNEGTHNVLTCLKDKSWGPFPAPECTPKDCGSVICPTKGMCEICRG